LFEDLSLDRRLRLGLAGLGLDTATAVQAQVVPAALAGSDLLVSAETGSGKTLAYLVPAVQKILALGQDLPEGTLALVLVPTRELARQVLGDCRALIAKTPLRVEVITGGADSRRQRAWLRRDPELVVATPGRLLEHCERGSADLSNLQTLVLDEADRMLDMGLREEVLGIAQYRPPQCRIMLLSATLGHGGVGEVARALAPNAQNISVGQSRRAHDSIHHQVILADSPTHKDALLDALLDGDGSGRTLVFTGTRQGAERLSARLGAAGRRSGCLHGELSTEERVQVMRLFSEGSLDVLCASDLAARGLDVPGIDLVVNYDMARSGDDYLHRTGRTGRAGREGRAVSLVTSADWKLLATVEKFLGTSFERGSLPGLKARYNGPTPGQDSTGPGPGNGGGRSRGESDKRGGRRPRRGPSAGNDGTAPLRKKRPRD